MLLQSPWSELDREEEALKKTPLAGLGFNDDGERTDYGGKVDFSGVITLEGANLHVKLSPLSLGPSCRFKRRFGSPMFLTLKPSQDVEKKAEVALRDFVKDARPLVCFASVFRPYFTREHKIHYVKTNEKYDGSKIIMCPFSTNWSWGEFLQWVNPPELNTNQVGSLSFERGQC